MNRRLQKPGDIVGLPEVIEEYLDEGRAMCVAFSRRGTMLAVGTEEGSVVIYNCLTRGAERILEAHSGVAVQAVSWSADGHYVASGGADGSVVLHDVLNLDKVAMLEAGKPVTSLQLSPSKPFMAVATLASGAPVQLTFSPPKVAHLWSLSQGAVEVSMATVPAAAALSRDASLIYVGGQKGLITVLDAATLAPLDVYRVQGSPRILSLQLSRRGEYLLASCHDRILRLLRTVPRAKSAAQPLEAEQLAQQLQAAGLLPSTRAGSLLLGEQGLLAAPAGTGNCFQNPAERSEWVAACFSHDSEHVVGGSRGDTHSLYIWNSYTALMERILTGPKEQVRALAWHPAANILASVASSGRVYLWAKLYDENWSAFAPDFEELAENREYVEREDEFDVNERPGEREDGAGVVQEELVDVLTRTPLAAWSDGEEEGELLYLPLHLEPPQEQQQQEEDEDGIAGGEEEEDDEEDEDEEGAGRRPGGSKRKADALDGRADDMEV